MTELNCGHVCCNACAGTVGKITWSGLGWLHYQKFKSILQPVKKKYLISPKISLLVRLNDLPNKSMSITFGEHLAARTWHPAPAVALVGATETLPPPLLPWPDNVILAAIRPACFMPSNSRIRSIFGGRFSMGISTRLRHSGHLSSCFVLTISSRHRRQNVCWHGNTLLDNSNLSRQTEHSNSSFNTRSSIL